MKHLAVPRRSIHLFPGEARTLLSAASASPREKRTLIHATEDAFARHIGVRDAIPVGAGRLGLRLILTGLGVGPGDEVLLPAFTDQSVPNAIRRVGATPVYVDIQRSTHNLDPSLLSERHSPRCRAIIATHLFGAPCDMKAVLTFARRHHLAVIEDCAHAIDAHTEEGKCGSIGDAAIFSFVVTKAINAFGGGMVTTRDPQLARHIRSQLATLPTPETTALLRRVLAGYVLNTLTRPEIFGLLGAPALRALDASGGDIVSMYNQLVRPSTVNAHVDTAFTGMQAAAVLHQLRQLSLTQKRRHQAASTLLEAMSGSLHPQKLERPNDTHAYYFLIATSDEPDAMVRQLLRHGIDIGRHPMRNCAALDDPTQGPQEYPEAEYVYQHALQFPIHPSLPAEAIALTQRGIRAASAALAGAGG